MATVSTRASGEPEYRWLAADDRGVVLEVIAAEVEPGVLLVLHVMPVSEERKST